MAIYRPRAGGEAALAAEMVDHVPLMWARYDQCCEYGTLADLPNAAVMFPEFEFIGSY
jgi:hypothetical protein